MTVGTARTRGVRSRLATAVVLAVVGVTGCSGQTGAAAVVEGEAIPVGDLHEVTRELGPFLQDGSPSGVLLLLVAQPVFERVAAEYGLGVSDAEARAALAGVAGTAPDAAGEDGVEFGDASLRVARLTILQQRLQQLPDAEPAIRELSDQLANLDVEVNPRYGEIDLAGGRGIVPVEHPWIVAADDAP